MKEKHKILMICHDGLLYGASRSLLNWIDDISCKDSKYEFIFLIPSKKGGLYTKLKERNYEIITLKYYLPIWKFDRMSLTHNLKNIMRMVLCFVVNPFAYLKLKDLCKKRKIEIIHSNSLAVVIGAQVAKKMGISHVWHVREYMEEDHMLKFWYREKTMMKYYKYSYAIFISKAIKEKYKLKFNNQNQTVIYNKVEYDVSYEKNRQFMEDGTCNILIAGKLAKNKGQKEAILAISELNKIGLKSKLYICGEGAYEEELKEIIKNKNLQNIEFLGFREDLNKIRANMDVALVCSKSEAFGRVSVEAMYYENLVIGADTAATLELIEDKKNGYLYKSECFLDLAKKIEFSIKNKEISREIIKNAKKEALCKYNNSIYTKILDIYDNIIQKN